MIGPEALEDAAWWAVQAAQKAAKAEEIAGSLAQDRLWSQARACAQVSQALAAVASAASDTQQIRRWGVEEWEAWDAVLAGTLPYDLPATSARAWHRRFCSPGVPFDTCPSAHGAPGEEAR
jgi:hypothetical protein